MNTIKTKPFGNFLYLLMIGILLFLVATPTWAAAPNVASTQSLVDAFQSKVSTWGANLRDNVVLPLFWTLAFISWAWHGIKMVLKGVDLPDFMTEMVTMTLTFGFWFWFIQNAFGFTTAIIDSMVKAAGIANGVALDLSPAKIMSDGLLVALDIISNAGWFEKIGYALAALIILFIFCYIAVCVLLALIEMYVVAGAGIIVLGFAGSPWTSDLAKKYLIFVFATGMKMFFTFLVVGLGISFIMEATHGNWSENSNIFSLIGISFGLAYLAGKVPELANQIVSGAAVGGSPSMGGVAKAAAGAALAAIGGAAALHQAGKAGLAAMSGGGNGGGDGGNPILDAASKAGGNTTAGMTTPNTNTAEKTATASNLGGGGKSTNLNSSSSSASKGSATGTSKNSPTSKNNSSNGNNGGNKGGNGSTDTSSSNGSSADSSSNNQSSSGGIVPATDDTTSSNAGTSQSANNSLSTSESNATVAAASNNLSANNNQPNIAVTNNSAMSSDTGSSASTSSAGATVSAAGSDLSTNNTQPVIATASNALSNSSDVIDTGQGSSKTSAKANRMQKAIAYSKGLKGTVHSKASNALQHPSSQKALKFGAGFTSSLAKGIKDSAVEKLTNPHAKGAKFHVAKKMVENRIAKEIEES